MAVTDAPDSGAPALSDAMPTIEASVACASRFEVAMKSEKQTRDSIGLFLRVHFPGGERFGPGKAQLLAAIADLGSISEAARSMKMSYRRAWLLVDSTNHLFGRPVVAAAQGGRQGGGAALTPFGRMVLARYRRLARAVDRAAGPDLRQFARWAAVES